MNEGGSDKSVLDTKSNPEFVDYYSKESLSEATQRRFEIVRRKTLKLARQVGLGENLTVADIGCGAGTQSVIWARAGAHVRGIDVNAALVRIARDRAANANLPIEFHIGSATALPYSHGAFDVCLLPELLEHINNWESCLNEAVRVLKPNGILFLSTTNWLCPKQQEFNLPLYSWYPPLLKRYFEKLASSSRPQLANYARYPAVNWFSYYQLSRFLEERGMRCLDRFDMIETESLSASKNLIVSIIRCSAIARFMAQICTPGTTIFAIKTST